MFVDELQVKIIAGSGGDGCTSFRREKYVPMGGPDGGNGGRGSNIIFVADPSLKTLIDLKTHKLIKGNKGKNGEGSNKYGANSDDIYIKVPMGTTVIDADTNLVLCDLTKENEEFIVCKGGRGGRGNRAFSTHDNPAPKFSEKGEPGEERIVKLELKMLADVGIIGMPSVGKSTLISQITASKPKIAAYHFTTLSPNLGVVKLKDRRSFVMADLPGLIKGASSGIGLGDRFLKHAIRTKILLHVIDMSASEGRDPIEDYKTIREELNSFDKKLARKKEIVVANKSDLPNFNENLEKFKNAFPEISIYEVSAHYNQGIDTLMNAVADLLDSIENENIYNEEEFESHMIYKFKNEKPYNITKEDDVWVISGDEIEKLFKMTRFNEDEGVIRFGRKLKGMGVDEELEKLGAKRGDEVRILDYTFEFKE